MTDIGYFLMADMLGFSQIVRNTAETDLDKRMGEWVSLIEVTASKYGLTQFQLISDTVFASAPSTDEDLLKLVGFSRDLLQDGVKQFFPIRGAIAHGQFAWGKLTYGSAVIEAHKLEQAQSWLGVACIDMPIPQRAWSLDCLVCYPPPFKQSRTIRCHAVVAWNVPLADELFNLLTWGGLTYKGEHFSRGILAKR